MLKYHKLHAVIPSKKARCPPCFVVAKTMFLFNLQKHTLLGGIHKKYKSNERMVAAKTCIHPKEWLPWYKLDHPRH